MEEVIALLATITACVTVVMFARALTHRLQGPATPKVDERVLDELEDLRGRVTSLQGQLDDVMERQDFAERLLAKAKDRGLLGGAP